ncbi:hypothetical protein WAC87_004152, partial [Shigella flexneri]
LWTETTSRQSLRGAGFRNLALDDARDMAIDSIMETFPESLCNRKCLEKQLDEYYEDMCKPNVLNANSGIGRKTIPSISLFQ